jgi:hypothetical protein
MISGYLEGNDRFDGASPISRSLTRIKTKPITPISSTQSVKEELTSIKNNRSLLFSFFRRGNMVTNEAPITFKNSRGRLGAMLSEFAGSEEGSPMRTRIFVVLFPTVTLGTATARRTLSLIAASALAGGLLLGEGSSPLFPIHFPLLARFRLIKDSKTLLFLAKEFRNKNQGGPDSQTQGTNLKQNSNGVTRR